jgi:3' terminal RNA ribose 2'-O-methyltransferase Hen1
VLFTVTLVGKDSGALGFLLHKHPDRVQTFSLPVGEATVFYPESSPTRTTAALLLEVDPIGMVKRRLGSHAGISLTDYVTDRPYAASSMLAVALGKVFGTALTGRCDPYPELAAAPLPLELRVAAVPSRASADRKSLLLRMFTPLGWDVAVEETSYGPHGSWGRAPYVNLTLTGSMRLADALSHLYVLLPVLDGSKHYWVGADEVTKLVRRGEGWLGAHPERNLIMRRYLAGRRDYVEDAVRRLQMLDDSAPSDAESDNAEPGNAEPDNADAGDSDSGHAEACDEATREVAEKHSIPLRVQRRDAVLAVVHEIGAHRVADVGCGPGYYLKALLSDSTITEVTGVDVSPSVLAVAERRLERLSDRQRSKLTLRQSSVTYRDDQLASLDAILLIEVIEHLEPDRLASLEASIFAAARPEHVVMTTPNREYNAVYGLAAAELRHRDHRFEWTRAEFADWAEGVADRNGYRVELRPIGNVDEAVGAPTQLALFSREDQ